VEKPALSVVETYSRVNGLCCPAGRQKTNCIVLHMRWNSTLVSTFHAPLWVVRVSQIESFPRTWRKRCSQQLNTDRPVESFSLVMRQVSRTIWTCCTINHKHKHSHFKQFTDWQDSESREVDRWLWILVVLLKSVLKHIS